LTYLSIYIGGLVLCLVGHYICQYQHSERIWWDFSGDVGRFLWMNS